MFLVLILTLSTVQAQRRHGKDLNALISGRVTTIEDGKETPLEYVTVQLKKPDLGNSPMKKDFTTSRLRPENTRWWYQP